MIYFMGAIIIVSKTAVAKLKSTMGGKIMAINRPSRTPAPIN